MIDPFKFKRWQGREFNENIGRRIGFNGKAEVAIFGSDWRT